MIKLVSVLLTAAIVFIANSCKKTAQNQETTLPDNVLQVKQWYESTYVSSATDNSSTQLLSANTSGKHDLSKIIKPDWKNTANYTRLGKSVFEVPVTDSGNVGLSETNPTSSGFDPKKSNSRSSFVILNDGKNNTAYVMIIIADTAYLKGDYSKLAHTTYKHRDPVFSGKVMYFTPKGDFVSGWHYTNGKVTGKVSTSAQTGSVAQVQNIGGLPKLLDDSGNGCSSTNYYFYEDTINVGNVYTIDIYVMTVTSCDDMAFQQNPDDGGGLLPPDDGGGGNSSTTTTTMALQNIVDSLQDTCLNNAFKSILFSTNQQNVIGNLINKTFGSNAQFNLTFVQSSLLSNSQMANTPPFSLSINAAGDSIFTTHITLNGNILPNSSQEFIATTILHESLHAYFEFIGLFPGSSLNQHMVMSQNYVNLLMASLQSVYPISDSDAKAIILSEMADYASTYPNDYLNLLHSYGLTGNQLVSTYTSYLNGTSGTKCH